MYESAKFYPSRWVSLIQAKLCLSLTHICSRPSTRTGATSILWASLFIELWFTLQTGGCIQIGIWPQVWSRPDETTHSRVGLKSLIMDVILDEIQIVSWNYTVEVTALFLVPVMVSGNDTCSALHKCPNALADTFLSFQYSYVLHSPGLNCWPLDCLRIFTSWLRLLQLYSLCVIFHVHKAPTLVWTYSELHNSGSSNC